MSLNIFIPKTLFDAAQAEVWRYMRKRPFPTFVRCIFDAALALVPSYSTEYEAAKPDGTVGTSLAVTQPQPLDLSPEQLDKQIETQKLKEKTKLRLKIPDVVFSGLLRYSPPPSKSNWSGQSSIYPDLLVPKSGNPSMESMRKG
mgnify:CR=1 FL=1